MILVMLGIFIGMIVAGWVLYEKSKWTEPAAIALGVCGALFTVISLIATIVIGVDVTQLNIIDEQIAMYQEENAKIEQQIDMAVKQYQDYESGVFAETSSESSITLVSLYPELKSDELVKKQLEVYMNNNEQIKHLKTKEINGKVYRWWLYFGG